MKMKLIIKSMVISLELSSISFAAQDLEADRNDKCLCKGDPQNISYSACEISNLIEKERLVEKIENYDNSFKIDNKDEERLEKRDEFFEISNKIQNAIMCLSAEEKKQLSQLDSTKCIVDKLAGIIEGYLRGLNPIMAEQTEFLNSIDALGQLLRYGYTFDSCLENVIASANSGLNHRRILINKAKKPKKAKKARKTKICKAR